MIVVDSNVICYYGIRGSKTALADRLRALDPRWCVPTLWRSEFRNVLAGQIRRDAMDLATARQLVELTEDMLRESEFAVDSRTVIERAVESGCTAYDCEYVVLAEDLDVRLVTSDRQVLAAFPNRAVALEDYVDS